MKNGQRSLTLPVLIFFGRIRHSRCFVEFPATISDLENITLLTLLSIFDHIVQHRDPDMKTQMNFPYTWISTSESQTEQIAERLVEILPVPAIVVLIGTLGAGKTRLVQAVAKAVGIEPETVSSPTYVLIHEYAGKVPIFHFDVYRLKSDDEFLELGPEEYFESPALCFIEWGDRIESLLPPEHFVIHIEILDETTRKMTLLRNSRQTLETGSFQE